MSECDDDELGVLRLYQRELSRLLHEGASAAQIRGKLLSEPRLAPVHEDVRALRDDALDVARGLVRRWAQP